MPHRVSNFFRPSTNSVENQAANVKKTVANNAVRRRNSPIGHTRNSSSGERVFSYTSSTEDDAHSDSDNQTNNTAEVRMPDSPRHRPVDGPLHDGKKDHHHHRLSFPGLHLNRAYSKERQQHEREQQHNAAAAAASNSHVSVDWKIESPPIVFHGDAQDSSGALVSGQMFLNIKEGTEVESFGALLRIHVTQKRPFTVHCHECTHQYTDIQQWSFLKQPLAMTKGTHQFPFSVLLGGHLPATMDGPLVSISYEFKAEMVPKSGSPLKFERTFDVKRSLAAPELPHQSVRVFPPTNVKASVHFPRVIHPIGTNTLSLRLDGLAKLNEKADTIDYWRLRKLTWRLEETAKAVAPACERHMPKEPATEQEQQQQQKKGAQRTDTRVIGEKTLWNGWKSNYTSATEANVECELEYALTVVAQQASAAGGQAGKHSCCDLRARDGTEVTHQLMVEMVVSQEWAPVGRPSIITQTGVGRILRMHFGAVLTERGGIGISWDNEAPPIYQDVPPSPPAYCEDRSPQLETPERSTVRYGEPLNGTRPRSMEGIATPPYVESPRLRPLP